MQQHPRHKLIRFWRDRADLEGMLRKEVFVLDDAALVRHVRDGRFVKVGSAFEQTWELENTGFCAWEQRAVKELASEGVLPARTLVPIPHTVPGERVSISVGFTAPAEPLSCRSVWKMVDRDERLLFPWAPGIRCQVLAVL